MMKKQATKSKGSIDRLSQLPQPILHRILCFLSQKEALQTCVLSKSWRYIGPTRPKLEFRESFCEWDRETFPGVPFLDKTLQRYHDKKLSIEEFRLWMSVVHSDSISFLEKWIPVVMLDMGVTVFDFSLCSSGPEKSAYIDLPLAIFKSKSILKLSLGRCKLNNFPTDYVILSKHLTTLSLTQVCIEDEALVKILLSCPLIVNLVLDGCEGLRTINVSKAHNKLKSFDFRAPNHNDDCSIKIDVPTIENIKIKFFSIWFNIHKYSFQHLKSLYLSLVKLSEKSLDNFSSKYPCLEVLKLKNCYGFKELHLSSLSIKYLVITLCFHYEPVKVVIETPSLVEFRYDGHIPQSFSFKTTASGCKSKITVYADVDLDDFGASWWCLDLFGMLRSLKDSKISLDIYQTLTGNKQNMGVAPCLVEACICGGGLCEPVGVECLSLQLGGHSVSTTSVIINNLFHICRPRKMNHFLDLDSGREDKVEQNRVKKLLREIFISKRELRNYSWQQDLEEVSFKKDLRNKNEFWFRLKWRD